MGRRNSISERRTRTTSKHDSRIYQVERDIYVNEGDEGEQEFLAMVEHLDGSIRKHYPKLFAKFNPPSANRIKENFNYIKEALFNNRDEWSVFDRSFLATAAIRYVDNFIDEVLWPVMETKRDIDGIHDNDREQFADFLSDVYAVGSSYDAYMPAEIVETPKKEFLLMSQPDQETFDENIEKYFFYKSFNLAYIEHTLTKSRSAESQMWSEEEKNRFLLVAAWDVSRDMFGWAEKTDFDIFKHIHKYGLDPEVMIHFVQSIIKNNAPKSYEQYSEKADDEYFDFNQEDSLSDFEKMAIHDCVRMIDYLMHIHQEADDEYASDSWAA